MRFVGVILRRTEIDRKRRHDKTDPTCFQNSEFSPMAFDATSTARAEVVGTRRGRHRFDLCRRHAPGSSGSFGRGSWISPQYDRARRADVPGQAARGPSEQRWSCRLVHLGAADPTVGKSLDESLER